MVRKLVTVALAWHLVAATGSAQIVWVGGGPPLAVQGIHISKGRISVNVMVPVWGPFVGGVVRWTASEWDLRETYVPGRNARPKSPAIDLSGVDLDAGPPPWAKLYERERVLLPAVKDLGRRIEPSKQVPPPRLAAKPVVETPELEAKLEPVSEAKRLAALGIAAFRSREYGLAARRFQQAMDADPAVERGHFLWAQALVALGQFSDAVHAIGLGLARDRDWPNQPYRPRHELYADHPGDWQAHVQALEDAQARQPKNAGLLFLLAYQYWFDDRRPDAILLFHRVRPLVADPSLVDLFLNAK
ncbi:MAG: hypothetical protein NZO58_05405 [Gemmataceae bacterium]|nr:hypothetical protein [Gemmataceae bacterium]